MKNIFLWVRHYFYPLLIVLIVGVLIGANYTPGTFLSGWDTLHPEFNLPLAFSRILTGVWRTDQGLGAIAIQSHMAELPRLLYLWITSFVLPISLLRYSYFFLMLALGPLGIYALIKKLLHNSSAAFTGALIYLCNFATVQQFIVPLEMFATQYGLLPWIILTILNFLEKPTKKVAVILAALSFFASAQAHTVTLLYAYLAELTVILTVFGLLHRAHWKRILVVAGIILATNLYIILPNIYAAKMHGLGVANSKVNRLFSPEAFAKGQLYGTPENAAILKNFLFDWQLYDNKTHEFSPVLGPWVTFANNPFVIAAGYGVFALSLAGFFLAIKKKQKILLSLTPLYIISFVMLINGTWPLPKLFDLLGQIAPVAREAIRFPFTKFSILFITGLSIFAAYGIETILKRLRFVTPIIALTLLFSFLPAFEGYLIAPAMRISIPREYFDMFRWFTTQPEDGRVAILPIHSFWNWTYYTWGYQGAGFLQFGIPQPILDRDYDRWSPANEQYEREMSYAVYSQNPDNIKAMLAKYNVTWVLVDNSVFAPASNENQTLLWQLPELLPRAGLTKVKMFGDNITIYSVPSAHATVAGYIQAPTTPPVNPYFGLMNTYERVTGPVDGTVIAEGGTIRFSSTNTPEANHITLPMLDHGENYILEITHSHESGFPLQLCVSNSLTSHCDLYVHLGTGAAQTERFLIPAIEDFGLGYSLDFNNFTIQGTTSVNTISRIRILQLAKPSNTSPQPAETPKTEQTERILPVIYKITVTGPVPELVLDQSYDPGWVAVKDGKILNGHTKADNWANGWTGNFGTSDIIYIIFWPQIFEWAGFILLPVGIFLVFRKL